MTRSLETRLRRIEQARAARHPAERMRATILQVQPDEDVAPLLAERAAAGTYRPNWPLVVMRGDWAAIREGRIPRIDR